MVFVFWQGIISIHQKAFLEALALQPGVQKVLLVVEEAITEYRKKMGWEVPVIEHIEIITGPANDQIAAIVKQYSNATHVMGGIRVGRVLTTAFDACVTAQVRLGIMTEPYNAAGVKGVLRSLKYQYFRLRYFWHIDFVLAIGKAGVAQYRQMGFRSDLVFPWAYYMTLNAPVRADEGNEPKRKIIYAGRLEEAKGICRFVGKLLQSGSSNYKLDIYGAGPDEEKIRAMVVEHGRQDQIAMYPFMPYEALLKKYVDYDWVVLPSTQKDGWGVIVSEGLLNGLKAICSGICGVSWAIKNGYNGEVFDWNTEGSCSRAIERMLHNNSYARPASIASFANGSISGEAGARYFLKIIGCVYEKAALPAIPWVIT